MSLRGGGRETKVTPVNREMPFQEASRQLNSRGYTLQDLKNASCAEPRIVENFYNGREKLIAPIAFGLAHLTGLSVGFWLELQKKSDAVQTGMIPISMPNGLSMPDIAIMRGIKGLAQPVEDSATRSAGSSNMIMKLESARDLAGLYQEVSKLIGPSHQSKLIEAKLVSIAMRADDAKLFRMVGESLVADSITLSKTIALARIEDRNIEISKAALMILYGLEPIRAVAYAYTQFKSDDVGAEHKKNSAEVLLLFARHRFGDRDITVIDTDEYMGLISSCITTEMPDEPLNINTQEGDACRVFCTASDFMERNLAMRNLVKMRAKVTGHIVLLGLHDESDLIRGNSLQMVQLIGAETFKDEVERLTKDPSADVRNRAVRILERLSAQS